MTDTSSEHTFEGLKELTNYTITIVGIKGAEKTLPYIINVQTLKEPSCLEGENVQTCLTRRDKEQNTDNPTLLFHNSELENGASDNVHNYVCLDSKTGEKECANDDLYRIIGLFTNAGEYQMKLIKADYTTSKMLGAAATNGETSAYKGNYIDDNNDVNNYIEKGSMDTSNIASYFWTSSDNHINLWKGSALNTYNLNTKFKEYLENQKPGIIDHIEDHEWITAGNIYDNIANQYANNAYKNEITNYDRTGGGSNPGNAQEDDEKTKPTKIGLMYVSDYGYAAYLTAWTSKNLSEYSGASDNNWMYMGLYDWTITRQSDNSGYGFYISDSGNVKYSHVISNSFAVRSCFYLSSTTKIASGKGTKTNPYRITW